ncbi:MAG: hypothetical protein ACI4K7_09510, partial [Oscillospiraceae bacterium]
EGKTSSSTVTFSKSRTKKYFEKLSKTVDKMSEDPSKASVKFTMVSKNYVLDFCCKSGKIKYIAYINEDDISMGLGIYIDSNSMTLLDLGSKQKIVSPIEEGEGDVDISESVGSITDFGISDKTKGKLFKFKYNDKGYYYEVFTNDNGETVGCVFDTKLNPVMLVDDTGYYTVKITTSVKSSDVKVPSGYEEIEMDY